MKLKLFVSKSKLLILFLTLIFSYSILFLTGCASMFKPKPPEAFKDPVVVLKTNKGKVVIEIYPESAPKTVANFRKLVAQGFYDGLTFHRYVEDFVIQGGDPEGTGAGGPGYTIPDEFDNPNQRPHLKGTVAMAKTEAPDSAGSQFYICLKELPHLDGNYTTFGKVIEGMDTVMKLRKDDVIRNAIFEERSKYVKD
jgi:peptidyl-prolyl cis-trans isomerase B (cyclophilin B)